MLRIKQLVALFMLVGVLGTSMLMVPVASAHSAVPSDLCHSGTIMRNFPSVKIGPFSVNLGASFVSPNVCADGHRVWQSGSINCSYVIWPSLSANQTWCGVYTAPDGSYADVGSNFTVSGWGSSFPCSMRVRIGKEGTILGIWGC